MAATFENLTDADYAYLAGMIDGEGCIQVIRGTSRHHRTGAEHRLNVSLSGTAPTFPRWLQARWQGNVHRKPRKTASGRSVWMWSVGSIQARDFLSSVLPFLTLKREEAQLALEFQATCKWRRGGFPRLTDEDMALRDGYRFALQAMHHVQHEEAA